MPEQPSETTARPRTTQEAFTENENLAPALRGILGGGSEFAIPSQQSLGRLTPSQRTQVGAGLRTMGFEPEDVFEASRRLTSAPLPAQSVYKTGKRRLRPSLL